MPKVLQIESYENGLFLIIFWSDITRDEKVKALYYTLSAVAAMGLKIVDTYKKCWDSFHVVYVVR